MRKGQALDDWSRMGKKYLVVFLSVFLTVFMIPGNLCAQAPDTEEDIIKKAADHFENQDYPAAMPLYSQLLANHPKDPNYNYRFGVCMLFANADKGKALPFLEVASKDPKAEVEVWFYLGRAYHLNYRFDEAIRAYTKYKTLAGEKKAEKLQVDNQIAMCKTGKKLLKAVTDITVLEKKELPVGDFFRSYNLEGYSGQLLVKGDEFKTNLDRKKKETSIIFLSGEKNILYFSSYGDNEENGKDIYRVVRLPTGGWSKPYNVGYPINTEYDEDYPFLHPNGKVLYFSSKGHNSMGGYDIFRSELNEETGSWLKPENMDFAINSPDDDILFVTDYDEKTAWFASARNSPQGMMTVYHVVIERKPVNACLISGKFKPSGVDPSASSKITVRNEETNQPVGVYKSNDQTGAYLISLPNTGGKYTFTVEKSGMHTQTKTVFIPPQYEMKPVRQEIFYTESNGDQLLNVVTYFDEDSASFAPDFLKDKANLDVGDNSGEYQVVDLGNPNQKDPGEDGDPDTNNDSGDVVPGEDPITQVPSSQNTVTTEELVTAAFENSEETKKEATQLDQQKDRAYTYANKLNADAKAKQAEADKAKADAMAMPDGPEKVAALQKADDLQAESNALQSQTVAAFNVAEALNQDAKQKDEEAKLASDYASSLQTASKSNDPKAMDAVAKKELALQNQSAARPQGEELVKNLQESADKKREQLQTAKSQAQDLRDEKKSNEDLIANLKADAAKEKDPDLKAGYEAQIEGIQETIADNDAEIKKADAKVSRLQGDVNDLDNQVAAASNAMNESKNPAVAAVEMTAEDKKALSDNVVTYQQRVDYGDAGIAPVVQNPNNQTPNNQTANNQTPVTQDPNNQTTNNQTPNNQTPVTQNPNNQTANNQTPVTQDPNNQTTNNQTPNNQSPVNQEPIVPAAEAITDVQSGVSEKIQTAEDIADPVRKEEVIGEAHRTAEQALEEKIAATQQQLANESDPARKSELQNNISELTAEKERQHQLAEESNKRSEEAVAAARVTENPVDPFAEYSEALVAADTITDPAQKENKKAETYTEWAKALDQKIADDKKTLAATKDKTEKDSLKQVIAADQKKSAELKQDAKTAKENEKQVIAQQNSPGAKSDLAYANQVAELNQNANVAEREAAKEALYTTWADSLDKEAEKRDALAAKERNASKKADLIAQAKDLRTAAEEKRTSAETSRVAVEQATVAQNPVVQNPTTQNPVTQTQGAVVEEGVTYVDAEAKTALTERDVLNVAAKQLRAKQDSLINVASGKSGEEKTALLADASEAQRQAWNKEAEASAKQGEANQEQFNTNATALKSYESGANGNTNPAVESAGLLNDEAAILLQRAKDKRAEAKLASSQYQRSEALSEAEDLEQQALIKQQEAIVRYQQAGVQPTAIVQNPTTQNPTTQNPTTQTADVAITNPSTGQAYTPEQVQQIRATPEYENYTAIEKEAAGYDEEVTSLTRESDKYQQSADYNVQQAQVFSLKAADETDPTKKREYVEESAYFNNEAKKDLAKRDSVNELANNAKAESRSKHNEADLFLNELDKKTYEDVKTVGDADVNKVGSQPVVQNPTTQNPVTQDPTTQNPISQDPTTQNPVTQDPTTQNPVNQNPTTQNPVTQDPTTQNPVNQNPTTQNPVTQDPTTQNPVTQNPTTQNPVTQDPTTQNPVTQNPTTQNPDARITNPATGQAYTPEQVAEVRSSPEYDNYVAVEKEAEGYDEEAVSLKRQADKYQQSADYNVAQAQDFSVKAADETDPEKKRALVEQAKYYNEEARSDMSKRDSVKELLGNAEMEADAKHSEAELYLADLDAKKGADVKAVATADLSKDNNGPVTQTPNNQTPNNQTANNQTPNNQTPSNQTPNNQTANNQTPNNQTPNNQTANNQTPNNQTPNYQTPNNQTPNNQTANNQTPDPGNTSRVANSLQPGEQFRITAQPNITPIPLDPPVPSGIVYKVQIGAFRNPIPLDLFKGIQPVTAESAGSGITRYTAGLFTEFANADAAKNEIRAMGYPDAFVVAFRDGKRISVAEARRNGGNQTPNNQVPNNQTPNNQVPNNQTPNNQTPNNQVPNNQTPNNQTPNTFEAPATDVKSVQGLFYTVQVGVYSRPVSAERLFNLTGLFSERTANGYIRYASGKYDNANAAIAAKNNIVAIGIKDAFVTAYFEGQRITLDRAAQLEREGVKPEGNNQGATNQTPANQTPNNQVPANLSPNNQSPNNQPPNNQVPNNQPTNNQSPNAQVPVVTNTKPNVPDTGLVFCIQLGAYREVVPVAMANRFLQFASRGVSIYKDANTGLTVYQVGTLNTYDEASQLRAEALAKGITDAFVVAWKDGKKISVEEALKIRPQ